MVNGDIEMKLLKASICAAVMIGALSAPASASYRVLKWSSGFCQIWDAGIPGTPWPNDWRFISREHRTFGGALRRKMHLVARGECW